MKPVARQENRRKQQNINVPDSREQMGSKGKIRHIAPSPKAQQKRAYPRLVSIVLDKRDKPNETEGKRDKREGCARVRETRQHRRVFPVSPSRNISSRYSNLIKPECRRRGDAWARKRNRRNARKDTVSCGIMAVIRV